MHLRLSRVMARSLSLVAPLALALGAGAQVFPGHSIVAVSAGSTGEMWDVDHEAGTATQLTISPALVTERPNCVLMVDPVTGFIGTNPPSGSGDVYLISLAGTMVNEVKLNTTPSQGGNVAQLALLAGRVYFTTQDASGSVGVLQSVPVNGGPVQIELDLSTVGALGPANACCTMGGKVYAATFDSSPNSSGTTPGELVEYDPATMTGRLVMQLPAGGFDPNGNPWNTGIVNMRADPLNPGVLALLGVYGDLLLIDPATATVVRHDWTGTKNPGGNALASGSVNSFSWDPIAEDWVVGTRDGSVERWVGEQQAQNKIGGVGSSTSASLGGIEYMPVDRGIDVSYGPGCPGNEDWEPTDSSFGAPIAGNSNFRLGLFAGNGGDNVAVLIGNSRTSIGGVSLPVDLAFAGITPNCFLRTNAIVTLGATLSGSGPGTGQTSIALPLPMGIQGTRIFRQWVAFQSVPTNTAGNVVSNARMTEVR